MNSADLLDMGVDPDDGDGVSMGCEHPGYSGFENMSFSELVIAADDLYMHNMTLEHELGELSAKWKSVPVSDIDRVCNMAAVALELLHLPPHSAVAAVRSWLNGVRGEWI